MDQSELSRLVRQAVRAELEEIDIAGLVEDGFEEATGGDAELARRWEGGTLVFIPGNPKLAPKEIPIETFWKKVTAVRERLRVLEQKVNNHKSLDRSDRAELQGLISRAYGSLTTFNVFFAEKDEQFSGTSG